MLRTIILACALAATAGLATAEEAGQRSAAHVRAEGLAIMADDGSTLGRVRDVLRDEDGRIVSVSAADLEAPADAPPYLMRPRAPAGAVVVAENSRGGSASQSGRAAR